MEVINQNNQISFRCTYLVEDTNAEIRLINDGLDMLKNQEISSKIKILNNGEKENLTFFKKFDEAGIHVVDFIIEEIIYNMSYMFNECTSLIQVEFISCNTSKVNDMRALFRKCIQLEYVDLSPFDTGNVFDMNTMFSECRKLKAINGIENLNTLNVINMHGMFQLCEELEYLDLSNFNTYNVRKMTFMFNQCHSLKEIKGIEKFDTFNVINMQAMFQS